MDDPSFYGFPPTGEATRQGGAGLRRTAVDRRRRGPFEPDPATRSACCRRSLSGCCPASARRRARSRCLYTLTPDRDFVLGAGARPPVGAWWGSAPAHGFKFAPTFGRVLADLALDGATTSDIAAFAARPAGADRRRPPGELAGVTMRQSGGWRPGRCPARRQPGARTHAVSWRAASRRRARSTCTARPSSSAVMRQAAPFGSSQVISPRSTPCRITSATVSFQRTSRACEHLGHLAAAHRRRPTRRSTATSRRRCPRGRTS